MKIAYLIIAHEHPELLARLVTHLQRSGGIVIIHYDKKRGQEPIEKLQQFLGASFDNIIWAERESVVWGEWTLVQATLNGLVALRNSGLNPDYVYLLSGSDYPVRPLAELNDFLECNQRKEFIESFSDKLHNWVIEGIQKERYLYRFPFNWGKNPRLFSFVLKLQIKLGLRRHVPETIDPHFGSQWWALTWKTCKEILVLADDKVINKFFRGVWVPDELFFQTLVRNVAHHDDIRSHTLTLYQFASNGTPVVYCNGHEDYLRKQNFFFARKVSPYANTLRDQLDHIIEGDTTKQQLTAFEAGIKSSDYENHCRIHEHGLFGKQIIGKVHSHSLGDLYWNKQPYFVVIGASSAELRATGNFLNSVPDILCHGELFHEDKIGFTDNAVRYAGFSASDIRIRDSNPQNFLVQLLHEDSARKVAFMLNPVTEFKLVNLFSHDPNARFIIVHCDTIRAFLETNTHILGKSTMFDTAHEAILSEQDQIQGLYVDFHKTYSRRMTDLMDDLLQVQTEVIQLQITNDDRKTNLNAEHLASFYHGSSHNPPLDGLVEHKYTFKAPLENISNYCFLEQAREAIERYTLNDAGSTQTLESQSDD